MRADIAKCETDTQIGMRVYDTASRLEEGSGGKDFDENRGAHGQRMDHIQVASVKTYFGHADT